MTLLIPKSRWQEEPVGNAYILRGRAVVAHRSHKPGGRAFESHPTQPAAGSQVLLRLRTKNLAKVYTLIGYRIDMGKTSAKFSLTSPYQKN